MADVVFRPIDRTEFPAYFRTLVETFGEDVRDADREVESKVFEPERSLAGFDGDLVAATAAICTRQLTVPGGPVPIAAVTMVSVAPTHRRRGLLTEMMRRQLSELHSDRREAVAALWASEGGIYGRFGYGLAVRRASTTGRTADLRLRSDIDRGTGHIRLATAEEARPRLVEVYEQVRPGQVGWLDRSDAWWNSRFSDPEHWRDGASALRYALHVEQDGRVTGYAVYRIKQLGDVHRNDSEVQLVELTAVTPQAYAAVWSFVTNLDLIPVVRRRIGPLDEPFQHQIDNPRALAVDVLDGLWVRLVDVGRALAGRTYGADLDVVFEVADEFCPWNAGRWRLRGGPDGARCEPTEEPADLALTSTELGAAYLGGTTLSALAAAGRVAELRQGALPAASRALAGDRQPWCPEVF